MSKNHVFINELGIIEIAVIGDQTVETVESMGRQTEILVKQRRQEGEYALVLDNVLNMGVVPAEARKRVVELAKLVDYNKLAMVGRGTVVRLGSNLLLQAIGKSRKVKYFDDYDEAVAWLRAK